MASKTKQEKRTSPLDGGPVPVVDLPDLPEGWAWVNMATSKGWGAKDGNELVYHQGEAVYVAVPITFDAQEAAINYSTTFETPEGVITVSGPAALAARQYFGGYEGALRGPIRDEAMNGTALDAEIVQQRAIGVRPYNGRSAPKTVDEAALEAAMETGDVATLKKLLAASGVRIKK